MVDQDAVALRGRGRAARSRKLLGLFFIQAGVAHFVIPKPYRAIVPPGMGDPATRRRDQRRGGAGGRRGRASQPARAAWPGWV